MLMKEPLLKDEVKRKLLARYYKGQDCLVFEELGLRHGLCRIDLLVANGLLHGFELKSDADSLKRLALQAEVYSSVLDKVTLVVGGRHLAGALGLVPDWWGITSVSLGGRGSCSFVSERRGRLNRSVDKERLAKLLWRDEALELLEEMGAAEGVRFKPRPYIYARLGEVGDLNVIRARVCRQLKVRGGGAQGEAF
jgi:hypothetical protein